MASLSHQNQNLSQMDKDDGTQQYMEVDQANQENSSHETENQEETNPISSSSNTQSSLRFQDLDGAYRQDDRYYYQQAVIGSFEYSLKENDNQPNSKQYEGSELSQYEYESYTYSSYNDSSN